MMYPMKQTKKDQLLLILALIPLFVLPAAAEESQSTQTVNEIVVTASRSETLLKETTKSIDIVDAEERDEL